MCAYQARLDENLHELVGNLKAHCYRAPMVRRAYIPKAGNPAKLRPLGIPASEDRLLQAAVARVLGAIYEPDFLDCSYGFRPGRSALHTTELTGAAQSVDPQGPRPPAALMTFPRGRPLLHHYTGHRRLFHHLDHDWLIRMLELRIGDPGILRLIGQTMTGIQPAGTGHRIW